MTTLAVLRIAWIFPDPVLDGIAALIFFLGFLALVALVFWFALVAVDRIAKHYQILHAFFEFVLERAEKKRSADLNKTLEAQKSEPRDEDFFQ